jgi:hypothetical protein
VAKFEFWHYPERFSKTDKIDLSHSPSLSRLMRYLLLLIIACLSLTGPLAAQSEREADPDTVSREWLETPAEESELYEAQAPTPPPPVLPVATRPVAAERWADAAAGLDYSKDRPKPPKPERQPRTPTPSNVNWDGMGQFLGNLLQTLLVIIAIVGIAIGIYRMLQEPRNRRILRAQDGVEITEANLDQYLHETDLDRFLRAALANGNYALAIRLYYLQAIKDLSGHGNIKWAKEKTNRDYLREMRNHPQHDHFRSATHTFERVWYGNEGLSADEFARLEPQFKSLLASIR